MNKSLYLIALSLLLSSVSAVAQDPPGRPTANRSAVEILYRLDQLEKEIRQLRGDMEVVNHELSGIKRRQRELYLDIDRRLSDLELASGRSGNIKDTGAGNQAQMPGQTSSQMPGQTQQQQAAAGTASPVMPGDKPQPPTREEKDAYRMAFNLLKEGRYDRSIRAFSSFLAGYPNSTYADNAQYWLGEANYVSRKYSAAVKEFGKVVSNFPDSTKAPDAMLKLGFTHYELKQWDKAREMLNAVMQKYPKSSAAKLAETRLKRMQGEGH
jgi:tol-pal system protein YbgF